MANSDHVRGQSAEITQILDGGWTENRFGATVPSSFSIQGHRPLIQKFYYLGLGGNFEEAVAVSKGCPLRTRTDTCGWAGVSWPRHAALLLRRGR